MDSEPVCSDDRCHQARVPFTAASSAVFHCPLITDHCHYDRHPPHPARHPGRADVPAACIPYLRQFLSDRRVIEAPRPIWLPLLYLRILPFRSAASAAKYRRIWDPKTGSPLLHYTKRQTELLQPCFPDEPGRLRHDGRQPAGQVGRFAR